LLEAYNFMAIFTQCSQALWVIHQKWSWRALKR